MNGSRVFLALYGTPSKDRSEKIHGLIKVSCLPPTSAFAHHQLIVFFYFLDERLDQKIKSEVHIMSDYNY